MLLKDDGMLARYTTNQSETPSNRRLAVEPHDCTAIAPYNTSKEAIDVAKRMTQQWEQVNVTRHYKVMYHEYTEWEN